MRTSQLLLSTQREKPAEAEVISHQLMLKAGMIRKLASGLYTWLPLGLRVLKKVENIVREEMDRAGAQEILMPAVQPSELWKETARWDEFGPQLLKITDRHKREFCFGPTHEEVITDLVRNELQSYKQLPINLYQIQSKFRDEIRPRFGIMRAREFLMKDAYSFHLTTESLETTYQLMFDSYNKIFDRIGLHFRAVLAETGSIGGSLSHEFQVLAESGEDQIFYSDTSSYAANIELAEAVSQGTNRPEPTATMETIDTPGQYTIDDLCGFLKMDATQSVKTLLVKGTNDPIIALILRGDHELNTFKAEKHSLIESPLTFADNADIKKIIGCDPGSIGPVGLNIPVIVDRAAAILSDFVCGANENDKHLKNVNWERDVPLPEIFDMRNVVEGDPSPDGKGSLLMARGIEVGHIFMLGDKYSKSMNATVLDENGKQTPLTMGCYGLGVSRVVAAAIEQNHDDNGIIWPEAISPYHLCIVPMNYHKSERVSEAADNLYQQLRDAGLDVLLDDRKERAGVLFADMDLIGIPHRIIIGERGLDKGMLEYKRRGEEESKDIEIDKILDFIKTTIKKV